MSDPANSATPAKAPSRVLRFFKRLLVSLIVLTLLAGVLYLLSERNARQYRLTFRDDGALAVQKGLLLPMGFRNWHPEDLETAETYAPFLFDEALRLRVDPTRVYAERDALDRALFELLREAVEQRSGNPDPAVLEEAIQQLRRAARLSGITEAQRATLQKLQVDVAFFEGRLRLREAAALMNTALAKLRLAADSLDSKHANDARLLLDQIQKDARAIWDAAQLSVALEQTHKQGEKQVEEDSAAAPEAPAENDPAEPEVAEEPSQD